MRFSKAFIIFTLASMVLFALFPEIDLLVSGFFYREDEGFFLKDHPLSVFFHDVLGPLFVVTFVSLFAYLYYQKRSGKKSRYFDKKALVFLLIFLLTGPALVTNLFLKEVSGRVRPVHVTEFGGKKIFTPYYKMTGTCKTNCSFISGHAAAAFFFMAFGYVMRSQKIFLLGVSFGVFMSLTRVVQGGHFFSDVLFAFIINFIILKGLYYLFYKEEVRLV